MKPIAPGVLWRSSSPTRNLGTCAIALALLVVLYVSSVTTGAEADFGVRFDEVHADLGLSPSAVTDTSSTSEDTAVAIRVLDNDVPGAYPLVSDSVAVSVFPANGSADWTVPGVITYTASPDFSGTDTFQYVVCDTASQCDYGAVIVTVIPELIEPLSGRVTNGGGARVSVYSASTGTQVATKLMTDGHFSFSLTESVCPGGYKVYFGAPAGLVPEWYGPAANYSSGACAGAPAVLPDVTLTAAVQISGYVKDATTASDINGASVYAFRASDGTFAGWSTTGSAGSGRYSIPVPAGVAFRLKVVPPSQYPVEWYRDSASFSSATDVSGPATADFELMAAGAVEGFVKRHSTAEDVPNASVYAWDSATGAYVGRATSDSNGRYSIPLNPNGTYKIKVVGPSDLEDRWYDGSPGWSESTPVSPPATANFSLREAGHISGSVQMPDAGVLMSAYGLCACTSPVNSIASPSGEYVLKVPATSVSGELYRVRAIDGLGNTWWFAGTDYVFDASPVAAPSTGVDLSYGVSPGQIARARLANALTAENVYYTDMSQFADGSNPDLVGIEPSITWTTGSPTVAGQEVRAHTTPDALGVCLVTLDSSGYYWAMSDLMVGPDPGIYRFWGASDPLPGCTEASASSGASDWP